MRATMGYGRLPLRACWRQFIAFWLRHRRVAVGMNVDVWDMNDQVQALARSRHAVEAAALAAPGTLLGALAGEPAAGS